MLQLQGVASDKHQLPLDKKFLCIEGMQDQDISVKESTTRVREMNRAHSPSIHTAPASSLPFKTPDKDLPSLRKSF